MEKSECLSMRRGKGLMQGLVVKDGVKPGDIVNKALDNGLIVITAGSNVVRMVPPLVITKEHVDEMIEKLQNCL